MMSKVLSIMSLYLLAFGLAVLPISFMQFGLRADILPNLGLCVVYFFATHRQIGALQIFIYGLFVSEIYGSPLGLESLLFVVIYALCTKYRVALLSKKPFSLYVGFALVAAIYGAAKYVIMSLHYGHLFDYAKVVMQVLTTILFYPAVDFVMDRVRN